MLSSAKTIKRHAWQDIGMSICPPQEGVSVSDLRETLRGLDVFAGDLPDFDTSELPADPHGLLAGRLPAAAGAGVREPHAMTLSTAGADGAPTARVLIPGNVSPEDRQSASGATSRKCGTPAVRPDAALTCHRKEQARLIRIRGAVRPAGAADSAAGFPARSTAARAEALPGRQSTPLTDLATHGPAVREAAERLARGPGRVAPDWTLCTLPARSAEFRQADRERRHTRVVYRRTDADWNRGLLWP
jgi:pyridoxamine 5'-phosphate oxidase